MFTNYFFERSETRTAWLVVLSGIILGGTTVAWWLKGGTADCGLDLFGLATAVSVFLTMVAGMLEGDGSFWRKHSIVVDLPTLIGILAVIGFQAMFWASAHSGFVQSFNSEIARPLGLPSELWGGTVNEFTRLLRNSFWTGFGSGATAVLLFTGQLGSISLRVAEVNSRKV
jgi:hypothetical protein